MSAFLAVGVGGALGSVLRYGLGMSVQRMLGPAFPFGTLFVNFLGSFAIGMAYVWLIERAVPRAELHLFVTVGVLGGFTTFSAFSLETVMLLAQANYGRATMNILASLVLCFVATAMGIALARQL